MAPGSSSVITDPYSTRPSHFALLLVIFRLKALTQLDYKDRISESISFIRFAPTVRSPKLRSQRKSNQGKRRYRKPLYKSRPHRILRSARREEGSIRARARWNKKRSFAAIRRRRRRFSPRCDEKARCEVASKVAHTQSLREKGAFCECVIRARTDSIGGGGGGSNPSLWSRKDSEMRLARSISQLTNSGSFGSSLAPSWTPSSPKSFYQRVFKRSSCRRQARGNVGCDRVLYDPLYGLHCLR